MGRDALGFSFELSLVKEPQTRRKKCNNSRGLVNFWRKRDRRSWLIVVFQKPGNFVLVIQSGVKMLAHGSGMTLAQPVVQPLVVSVIESLLLHHPFHVPVDLGHEHEVWILPPCGLGGLGPEQLG